MHDGWKQYVWMDEKLWFNVNSIYNQTYNRSLTARKYFQDLENHGLLCVIENEIYTCNYGFQIEWREIKSQTKHKITLGTVPEDISMQPCEF